MALLFVTVGPGYGVFLTLVSVIAEELTYHRYPSLRDFALLVYAAVAEGAGFRQLHAWWRLRGLAGAVLRRGRAWAAEPGAEEARKIRAGRRSGTREGRARPGTVTRTREHAA